MLPALLAAQIHPAWFAHAAVVSDSAIASQVGAAILAKGGNAVDAAAAVGLAMAVTFPAAGNLGGGGFMMVRTPDGKAIALDYRETAPAAATKTMYVMPDGSLSPNSTRGHLAAGVPGTPAGLFEAHKRFGKLPWKSVVAPALKLAKDGFPLTRGLAGSLNAAAKEFKRWPASAEAFVSKRATHQAGDVFRQPDLAATLARLASDPADFYRGKTAQLIAADMKANGGLITLDDLRDYKVKVREPLRGNFRGHTVVTMPPPSSGGVVLLELLGMVERDDLASMGWNSSSSLHLMVEAMKRAFVNRSVFLGDPDFVHIPMGHLLDRAMIAGARSQIGEKATPSAQVEPFAVDASQQMERRETTHFSIVDSQGMAVANTYTLNGSFGSYAVVKGAGFLLNNEMDDFTGAPDKPNLFGLIQGEKNAIQPGKRPLSSMTPTFVERDGQLEMVLGSPGGPTIITTVFQVILNSTVYGMNIQRAVAAPRFHHQWMPDQIEYEPFGLPADVRAAMEARGHKFEAKPGENGSCHAIFVGSDGLQAGVDPRVSSAAAAGW